MTRTSPGRRTAAAAGALLALGAGIAACSAEEPPGAGGEGTTQADPGGGKGDRGTDDARKPAGTRGATPSAAPSTSETPAPDLPQAPPLSDRFVPAEGAQELASRIVVAEDAVRAKGTPEDVLQAAAFEAQLLYRQLARTPAWQERVLSSVGRYRRAVALHVRARDALRSVLPTSDLSDQLPAWAIREPRPVAELMRYYREGQRVHGVPWELLAAINLVETGFGKIDGLSSAGAQGPMQFIPSTWAVYGEGDVNDPHDAILGAANYLAASGAASGDVDGALYAYNNHPGYVEGIKAYAEILRSDPRALRGLHRWQIIYLSTIGDIWLPVGYRESAPVPVRRYVAQHPERHLGTSTR